MRVRMALYILLATVLGGLFGYLFPHAGIAIKPIGDAFIRLIKMVVLPVIASTLLVGVAGIGDIRRMGRIGLKTVVWFEFFTTLILLLGLVIANVVHPGTGIDLSQLPKGDISKLQSNTATVMDGTTLILNIIPTNFLDAMARSDMLATIFFCVMFGIALAGLGERAKPFIQFMEIVSQAAFRLVNMVMTVAPIGVFALMAATIGTYGVKLVIPLLRLIGTAYLALALLVFVVFPIVALCLRIRITDVYKMVWDLMLIGASTGSTETVVPQLMDRLERFGVPKSITSFVIPAGLPLNSDGTTLYLTIAAPFIAQLFGIHMTFMQQITMILFFIVTSKGVAAVPSSSMVILLATATAVGLPAEGVALILGVDRIIDMARTAVNVMGHVFSSTVVARWEGVLGKPQSMSAVASAEGQVETAQM
ncbi:MAG: cation:dicarboxylase symporter family transporter [Alicyclobacillus macrosporangiidus]|uniref:dicarboxylate/amino acid:cation symporter n=1 Tax=Alicyclobacillus macrosporangiidus TaxID=392015 RepID=UPI0026F21EB5|nr:cation:dicarboxylase symporter family transporter [Alicyclobacillus macrosporangiidus]MCL6600811.1 cation:dicarboxylase symporter family transporter [Alicyclobacillus macrosporangiidus]